jgi:hypothetical protein
VSQRVVGTVVVHGILPQADLVALRILRCLITTVEHEQLVILRSYDERPCQMDTAAKVTDY